MHDDNTGTAVITIIALLIALTRVVWALEESCNNHDSDGDGYVSCTYTVDGEARTVECAGSWTMQSGCRAPKPVLRTSTAVINSNRGR